MPQDRRYFCHHCLTHTTITRASLPTCMSCITQFVEETPYPESSFLGDLWSNIYDDDGSFTGRVLHPANIDNGSNRWGELRHDAEIESTEYANWDEREEFSLDPFDRDSEDEVWVREMIEEVDGDEEDDEEDLFAYNILMCDRSHQSFRSHIGSDDEYEDDCEYGDEDEDDDDDDDDYLVYNEYDYHGHDRLLSSHLHLPFFRVEQLLNTTHQLYPELNSETDNPESHRSSLLDNFVDVLTERMGPHRCAPSSTNDACDHLEKRKLDADDPEVETECIICRERFGVRVELLQMPCKHEYHSLCIQQWLQVNATCPICRCPAVKESTEDNVTYTRDEEQDEYASSGAQDSDEDLDEVELNWSAHNQYDRRRHIDWSYLPRNTTPSHSFDPWRRVNCVRRSNR